MNKDLMHPSWAEAGWTVEPVPVRLRYGLQVQDGLKHADAPGLAVTFIEDDGKVKHSITHVGTGSSAVLSWKEWPLCAVAVRDMLRDVCQVIDYASLTHETAVKVPQATRDAALEIENRILTHSCEVCAWWHDRRLPERIAEWEEEVSRLEGEVERLSQELYDAESDLGAARKELRAQKARMKKP